MSKILVTGGAGFIGYHLSEKLSRDINNQLVIADNLARGQMDEAFKMLISKPNVRFEQVDLTSLESMGKIWEYYDQIYHLAAIIGVKHCMNHPDLVLKVNLLSTLNIVELAKENHVKKIVFSSTCETYASGFEYGVVKVPTLEDTPLMVSDIGNPRLSYAVSKIAGEQIIIFNSLNNYDYSIVRYHNIYGQRMGYAHVIPEVLKRIYLKETPFKLYGANQTRSFCHVYDGVDETISVMNSLNTNGQVIHVGNDSEEILIKDLVLRIFEILHVDLPVKDVPAPIGSINRRCPNINKLRRLTGVSPKVSLQMGLDLTVKWYWNQIKEGKVWE